MLHRTNSQSHGDDKKRRELVRSVLKLVISGGIEAEVYQILEVLSFFLNLVQDFALRKAVKLSNSLSSLSLMVSWTVSIILIFKKQIETERVSFEKSKTDTDEGVAEIHNKDLKRLQVNDTSLPKTSAVRRKTPRHHTGHEDQYHKTQGHAGQYERAYARQISYDQKRAEKEFDPRDNMREKRDEDVWNDLIGRHAPLKIFDGLHQFRESGVCENQPEEHTSEE